MKSYEQIADSILEKYNSRLEAKRRRNKIIFRSAAVLSGAAAVIGIAIFTTALKAPKMPDPVQPGIIIESETTATNESEYITIQTKNEGTSLTSPKNTTVIKTETSSTVTAPQNTSVSTAQTVKSTATDVNTVNGTAQSKPAASTVNTTFAATAQTTLTSPETTTVVTTTVDNDAEGSNYMKKVISMLTAAAMLTPVAANNSYAADTEYEDLAKEYALGNYQYLEDIYTVNKAEQKVFDMIDKGIIDIDIDRNGEIDMRDAAYLFFYEMRRYVADDHGDQFFGPLYKQNFLDYDMNDMPAEIREFLENRKDIRDKEIAEKRMKNAWYYRIATLDTKLVSRYVITHNFKPEYFTKDYYSDVAVYDVIAAYGDTTFFTFVTSARSNLINIVRDQNYTEFNSLLDINGDGVFDLHDVQDYEECIVMYNVDSDDFEEIINADTVDMTRYREEKQSEDSITEDVFKNCVKLHVGIDKWEREMSFDFELDEYQTTSGISVMDMIKYYFRKNDFKLIYTTPEYYRNERPGCEGLPLYDKVNLYDVISSYAADRGYITTKLGYDMNNFYLFYEKWSEEVKNQTAAIPDINGNGVIDMLDYNYLKQYEKELWSKIPEEETKLPKDIRSFLDEDFDLNENGLSGDINDIWAAIAYIIINHSDVINLASEEKASTMLSMLKGDANCDGKVSLADSVAILQYIGNRDKYNLKDLGKLKADVNGDGAVTGMDALEIQRMDALDN
jgi:hypothetical protein